MGIDWNKWLTIVTALTVIVAIAIPLFKKWYEEKKTKISFDLYLKKYIGVLNNALTYDQIEYTKPSIKDNPEKLSLTFKEYILVFEKDFKEHQNTLQFRIAFFTVFNLQNLLFHIYKIHQIINQINTDKLYEHTLAYGNSLTKGELKRIYGLLLVMEHYSSITSFHDKFGNLKSIQRIIDNKQWIGLKVEKMVLENQQLIIEDLKNICNDELSLTELVNTSKILIQELSKFYHVDI